MRELDSLQGRGAIFISVANRDKRAAVMMVKELAALGFTVLATEGTAEALRRSGMEVVEVRKLREGRPNVLDYIRNGEVDLIVNTPRGKGPRADGFYIRSAAARYGIPCITDMRAATLLVEALSARREGRIAYCDIGGYRGEMGMEEG
jgi:carbamoyl-phosphate synthase large subunit